MKRAFLRVSASGLRSGGQQSLGSSSPSTEAAHLARLTGSDGRAHAVLPTFGFQQSSPFTG